MGVESDTKAWTAYGGQRRRVRIEYPRYWPPGWGVDPLIGGLVGVALVAGLTIFLATAARSFLELPLFGFVPFAAACIGIVLGVVLVVMAAADWKNEIEVTGPIVRLRALGDDKKARYYIAVDDGQFDTIRAWKVSRALRRPRAGRRDHCAPLRRTSAACAGSFRRPRPSCPRSSIVASRDGAASTRRPRRSS